MNISENVQRNGLIAGLSAVILFLVYYFIDSKLIFSFLSSFIPYLLIFPVFMTLSAIADKKDNGGYLRITPTFMSAFFTGALALFIMMTFLFILQTIIDPALIEVQKEVGLDSAIGLAEFISGEELSDDAIQEIQNEVERTSTTPTLGLTLLGYVLFTAFGAIPAIIIALFVRKEEDPLEKLKREQA
jgi:small-conductance mechanosensitive channel